MKEIFNSSLLILCYYFVLFLSSGKFVRNHICKGIFEKRGNNVNIDRLATFENGFNQMHTYYRSRCCLCTLQRHP